MLKTTWDYTVSFYADMDNVSVNIDDFMKEL